MKYFICFKFILCFCFYNCFAQISDSSLSGVYFYTHMNKGYENPMGNISLKINEDGTYVYEDRIGWQLEYSKGYWNFNPKKQKLFLKGIISSTDSIPMIVKEKNFRGSCIQILFNPIFKDTTQWSIVLNDKEYPIIPDSIILIKDVIKVDSFFIKGFLNVEYMNPIPKQKYIRSITYYPQKGYNFYDLSFSDSIDDRIFNYVPFHETLDVKGNNLVWNRKIWNKTIKLKKQD